MEELNQRPSEKPYGFQYVNNLEAQLAATASDETLCTDPRYAYDLVERVQQLSDTAEAWQAAGVDIATDEEATRIRRESTLRIFDHVTCLPVIGFTGTFLNVLESAQRADGGTRPPIVPADMASTIFVRTFNSGASQIEARASIAN